MKLILNVQEINKIVNALAFYGSTDVHLNLDTGVIAGTEIYLGAFEIETEVRPGEEEMIFSVGREDEYVFEDGKECLSWIEFIYTCRNQALIEKDGLVRENDSYTEFIRHSESVDLGPVQLEIIHPQL